jgi:molybdate transport system permease protein
MDWSAIGLSLRLATATTLILLVVGLPLAGWLALSTRRGRWAVDALVALPLVLPPTVLGFYVLVALGPRSPIGRVYEAFTGSAIVFSFEGLLVASVLYSLPFAVQPFAAAFAAVDRNLIETAWCLGASRARTFMRIVVPLARPGIVAGAVLSFAHTVGEFGVVLMVGGNIPGSTRTVSISIYDDVQAFDYGRAGRTAAILFAFSFVVLATTYRLQRRSGRAWPIGS